MRRTAVLPKIICCLFLYIAGMSFPSSAAAFWVWTPESGRWVNPKYDVKETPQDQLAFAQTFLDAKEYKKAQSEFEKLIKYYPRAREAAEAQYGIGLCRDGLGQALEAFKAFQTVIEKYPYSERSAEIIKRQYEIGLRFLDGKVKRSKFMKTVTGGDYDPVEIFRAVIKNAPYGEYAAPAQYKIGLYLQGKGLYQEARDEFEKTINDYPDSEWAKVARYQVAVSDAKRSSDAQYDQKVTEAAITQFHDFVEEYPDAELSADAKREIAQLKEKEAENHFLVARFYVKQKQYAAAKVYYTAIVEKYKDTSWASKALEKLRDINKFIK